MKKLLVLFCLIILVFTSGVSYSQVKTDSSEITSSVPALTDFHEVIFPMWHTAYPAKDINALKGFVPQIKTSMEAINSAVLPGILKDKEAGWNNQLKELNNAAENYYRVAEGNDDEALLLAAERLHSEYEKTFRVIRPVLKVIDDYHQMLYIIYHKLYPDGQYDEIAKLMDTLIERAEAIVSYPQDKLKKRLGENVEKYSLAASELYDATVSLKGVLSGNDLIKKSDAVVQMHTKYQHLEAVFK